ncbi:hypothetical protein Bca4012_037518 [Brassica carinata]
MMSSSASTSSIVTQHIFSSLGNSAFSTKPSPDLGLCKSQWERFSNNPAGKYKYDDVKGGDKNRFIVETTLAREFYIARPTVGYISLLAQLPHVFVGTPEELKQLVRIMSFEIRRSMKRAKTHVPPWRRNGYMQAK